MEEKREEKPVNNSLNIFNVIIDLLRNENVPKWSLGIAAIILVSSIIINNLNLDNIIQSKLDNDRQIALQIQTDKTANEAAVIEAIAELNNDLNERLENVLVQYNEQSLINYQLTSDNTKLNNEISTLKQEKDALQEQVEELLDENRKLQQQINELNTQVESIIQSIEAEKGTPLP